MKNEIENEMKNEMKSMKSYFKSDISSLNMAKFLRCFPINHLKIDFIMSCPK